MPEEKITQIQRYLIIAVLFLLCIVLLLLILGRDDTEQIPQQKAEFTPPPPPVERPFFDNQDAVFKEFVEDLNATKESMLSKIEQNTTAQGFDANLSQQENFEQNVSEERSFGPSQIPPEVAPKTTPVPSNQGAKLAIIIDDMMSKEQVKKLKSLNLKLNPSFFPPYKNHDDTPKLAAEFDFYMVHLPLEAIAFNHKLPFLKASDSAEKIEESIRRIKQDFKGLRYINNHTGSLFTSDERAMRKLFVSLKKYDLLFVDSRTIGASKALKMAQEFGQSYIKRDIFLDNEEDVDYTKNQLKNVVELAKKRGFAIAIGHPKKTTFKALEESRDLLKSVELVYLSEIYGE